MGLPPKNRRVFNENTITYESIGSSNSIASSSSYTFFSALHRAATNPNNNSNSNSSNNSSSNNNARRGCATYGTRGGEGGEGAKHHGAGILSSDEDSRSRRHRESWSSDSEEDGGGDEGGLAEDEDGVLTLTTNWLGMGGTISCGGLGRGLVLGLVLWATVASIAAISFSWRASAAAAAAAAASAATASASAPSRGISEGNLWAKPDDRPERGPQEGATAMGSATAATSSSSVSSSFVEAAAGMGVGGALDTTAWCLPNAVHQTFQGLILKEDDDRIEKGPWAGDHWWYHDAITNCFHILATVGSETYGFWEAGIIDVSGTTDYITAAYKDGECLYYQEEMVAREPVDDIMCRGNAWVGNVTLQGNVEYGYGTKAERWEGTIPERHNSGQWGLPPGTKSVIDLARNPDDDSEVRLLYHKIVAPTKGVLGWAGGDSMAFDFVFTGAESMEASEVQALVKVPPMCEVMAGEFHDEQARNHRAGAAGGPPERRLSEKQRRRLRPRRGRTPVLSTPKVATARRLADTGAE